MSLTVRNSENQVYEVESSIIEAPINQFKNLLSHENEKMLGKQDMGRVKMIKDRTDKTYLYGPRRVVSSPACIIQIP